jgi:hypothetical protein
VYEKDEGGELVLTGIYDEDVEAGVGEAREQCGWELRAARRVAHRGPDGR